MALINCPECSKEISDKAISCPNCGLPLNQSNNESSLVCPEFPADLSIGKQITNWWGDASIKGNINSDENVIEGITSSKVHIVLFTKGIRICNNLFFPIMDVHNSQIISLNQKTKQELMQLDKSVIGRAVVGGVLFGPFGAIIGGMSGIGSKAKVTDNYYLVINYWDRTTRKPVSILINSDKAVNSFIKRHEKEKNKD